MKLIATLMMCSFFLGVFPPVLAGGEDIDLTIGGNFLSAKLREVPLKIILERLERDKGIWFRGDSSLSEEEITVQFTELSFEEGLKRILASMNYSIIYDRTERVVGVIVIGEGTADHAVSEGRTATSKRSIPAPGRNKRANVNGSFTVMRNSLPPGGNVEVAAEGRENLKVIRNSPPPGGPVEVTEQERDNFTVIRNSPPPGDSVEVSAEELQKFKVIRNSLPPGS